MNFTPNAGHNLNHPKAAITPEALSLDPYPFFTEMRENAPIVWVEKLNMWYVLRHADVTEVLLDKDRFINMCERSTVFDTFGPQLLSSDGSVHARYRKAMQPAFTPQYVKQRLEPRIAAAAYQLIDAFTGSAEVELRSAFASRLPVQTILLTFDMPLSDEPLMREWYDSFEHALANFTWDESIRQEARTHLSSFNDHVLYHLHQVKAGKRPGDFLRSLLNSSSSEALDEAEIIRNLSISFFGGISTVEALILNSLWALLLHPDILKRVRSDLSLLPRVVDETIRWMSPVQSATRHVAHDTSFRDIHFKAGDTIACMLGAANRDPRIFLKPDDFDIDRPNTNSHVGFAIGPHVCIGFRLAKAQARIALAALLTRLGDVQMADPGSSMPRGYEFRQPPTLRLALQKS